MIITKKALPRRTFLRGMGATVALPLARRDGAVDDRAGQDAGRSRCAAWGSSTCRWAATSRAGRRPEAPLTELSPSLQSLRPFVDQLTVISNLELKNAYPGTHATSNAAFLSAAKAKWTESTDYYLGTTVDQIAAQQIGSQTLLPSLELSMDLLQTVGPVRQRLRLRLSEQSLVVVADDAAAGRSPSAHRLRAAVRRGRQRGRPARGAAETSQPARLGARRHHAAAEQARTRGSRAGRPVSRDRARSRAPHPESRGRDAGRSAAGSRSARGRAGGLCRPRAVDVRPAGAGAAGGRHAG